MPSDALLRMVRRWERDGSDPQGVVVVRHGRVVAEAVWRPRRRDGIRLVYSVSKTFLAIAAAFAESEGLLAREERLVDVFPDAAFAAGPRAAQITVEHCLRMATGHHVDTLDRLIADGTDPAAAFLGAEPPEPPGSTFLYHNGASALLALAVQRRTGQRLVDYLRPRLFDPVGVSRATWTMWKDADLGWSGLHVSTEAVARTGLLLLQDGVWQGRRLLPPGWVSTATRALTDTSHHPGTSDWQAGYGYQLWRCRPDGFRLDGAYGQFALVLPGSDLVVAVASCTETTQDVLDAVWEELLPHLVDSPLPPDSDACERLGAALDAATTPPASSSVGAPPGGPWAFRHTPTPEHPALRSVVVRRTDDGWLLDVEDPSPVRVACGDGRWPDAAGSPWVASGGWLADGVFEATVVALETPHSLRLRCADGTVSARWHGTPLHRPALSELRSPEH